MALIEQYHVVADQYPVDPDWTTAIEEGSLVTIDANGLVALCNATFRVLGVAGDTLSSSASGTPYAANIIVSGSGAARSTENRVSDFFNETLASSLMTVYHSGGRFATDQYVTAVTFAPRDILYSNAAGLFTNVNGGGTVVGTCVAAPSLYPSGVPGTAVDQSMSLGTFLDFILDI